MIRAEWTAPLAVNGDAVSGYQVYVDDGFGGEFILVFNGQNYPSTYQFEITEDLVCGRQYFVQVTAMNVAGEGPYTEQSIWLGEVPSEPLSPQLLQVTPETSL